MSKVSEKRIIFLTKYPWIRHLRYAHSRCNCKSNASYKSYGGKGIRFLLTKEEIKLLWFRDEAYKLQKPSIDRIDSNKNYELSNCRFIEYKINCGMSNKGKPPHNFRRILQFSLDGKLIKEHKTMSYAAKEIGIHVSSLSQCLIRKSKKSAGYIWRYKDD